MPAAKSRALYFLLALYMVCSLGFYVGCVGPLYLRVFHTDHEIHAPFQVDLDTLKITQTDPETERAGVSTGDLLESLNREPYRGQSHFVAVISQGRPGSTVLVGVKKAGGERRAVSLPLKASVTKPTWAETVAIVAIDIFLPLLFLLVGYWVVAARPQDLNAWLILVLLSFCEAFLLAPSGVSGVWLALLGTWFTILQVCMPAALFLFGIYFPERWRWDVKLPYVKWVFALVTTIALGLVLYHSDAQFFHPARLPASAPIYKWVDRIFNPINLLCVILFWVAIIDKLRTASTADARRRLRVLAAGSLLSLGSLLVVFILLPNIGITPEFNQHPWITLTGVILSLLFPVTVAYVVVVQRAMDVRILLRMGTKYALARASILIFQFSVIRSAFLFPRWNESNSS